MKSDTVLLIIYLVFGYHAQAIIINETKQVKSLGSNTRSCINSPRGAICGRSVEIQNRTKNICAPGKFCSNDLEEKDVSLNITDPSEKRTFCGSNGCGENGKRENEALKITKPTNKKHCIQGFFAPVCNQQIGK